MHVSPPPVYCEPLTGQVIGAVRDRQVHDAEVGTDEDVDTELDGEPEMKPLVGIYGPVRLPLRVTPIS